MRQIALDTETTGLSPKNGDRIIEIGCVEIIDRCITGNIFHAYCNPEKEIGQHITNLTGIKNEFLLEKPKFALVVDDFLKFINGAELVIHNAAFDLEFIHNELSLLNHEIKDVTAQCGILDTLKLARSLHPGQRNNLDALCKRYNVDVARKFHGALLDAEILAKLILKMTAGQISLDFSINDHQVTENLVMQEKKVVLSQKVSKLKIIYANAEEIRLHDKYLSELAK